MKLGISEDFAGTWVNEDNVVDVMKRLGFTCSTHRCVLPSHFLSFLLALCYPVAESEDLLHGVHFHHHTHMSHHHTLVQNFRLLSCHARHSPIHPKD